jgi:acetylglutamate kinase
MEVAALMGSVIKGGMIPKMESCLVAIEKGAGDARIINGTKPGLLVDLVVEGSPIGTKISK